jgi:hypothetical protein
MTDIGDDQLKQLRQEMDCRFRLLVAECADLRRTLAANGIEPPKSKLTDGRWIPVKQFAFENGIKESAVLMRIRRRKVIAEKNRGSWLVRADS